MHALKIKLVIAAAASSLPVMILRGRIVVMKSKSTLVSERSASKRTAV